MQNRLNNIDSNNNDNVINQQANIQGDNQQNTQTSEFQDDILSDAI